jgi:subtilisin family serine protease
MILCTAASGTCKGFLCCSIHRRRQCWDITTGSKGVVIAVIDTGVLFDHPDLLRAGTGGKLLPGYDFVSNTLATK